MSIAEKLEKLRELELRSNEARKLNNQAAIEEQKKKNLPTNWENKKRRLQWEEDNDTFKDDCRKKGLDPERVKNLDIPINVANQLYKKDQIKKRNAENPIDYVDATYKKYVRLTNNLTPDFEAYEKEKKELEKYKQIPGHHLMPIQKKDSKEKIKALSVDIKKQIKKKEDAKNRRKRFDPDATITYVNEKNKRFNDQLEKCYGEFTAELQENLERGTAL